MGQSTNAIMAFGIDLGEELPDSFHAHDDEDDGFESEHFLACDFCIEIPEWTPETNTEYWKAKWTAIAAIPIELIEHCSSEYPMYFLAVRGTKQTALRGHTVDADQRDIEPSEIDALRAFCERHGVEWKEPKWQIFSMWC